MKVFEHVGLIVGYARRNGSRDPEGVAAEVMTIAWCRLFDVPTDDPGPWLIVTARNLLMAEHRRRRRDHNHSAEVLDPADEPVDLSDAVGLSPALEAAFRRLSRADREALLLVAWDDLTPKAAAASLGITRAAFRARLHRARRHLTSQLNSESGQRRLVDPRAWIGGAMTMRIDVLEQLRSVRPVAVQSADEKSRCGQAAAAWSVT